MTGEVVFRREGALFHPTEQATGPWGSDRLHGGPVFGLLARAVEAEANDPALMVTRMTFDLFRPVPRVALEVRTEVIRRSARLCAMQAGLWSGNTECVRASALLLRAGEVAAISKKPLGPEGLRTESLMRASGGSDANWPPGYHTRVETRWVLRSVTEPLAIWFRLPIPLVEGELPTPLQRAAALSDFANAVASIADRERNPRPVPFINVDATLYLQRQPAGEWFALREAAVAAGGGVSVAHVELFDERGLLGHVSQARLENRAR